MATDRLALISELGGTGRNRLNQRRFNEICASLNPPIDSMKTSYTDEEVERIKAALNPPQPTQGEAPSPKGSSSLTIQSEGLKQGLAANGGAAAIGILQQLAGAREQIVDKTAAAAVEMLDPNRMAGDIVQRILVKMGDTESPQIPDLGFLDDTFTIDISSFTTGTPYLEGGNEE